MNIALKIFFIYNLSLMNDLDFPSYYLRNYRHDSLFEKANFLNDNIYYPF